MNHTISIEWSTFI